jgi:hypothetical protein
MPACCVSLQPRQFRCDTVVVSVLQPVSAAGFSMSGMTGASNRHAASTQHGFGALIA